MYADAIEDVSLPLRQELFIKGAFSRMPMPCVVFLQKTVGTVTTKHVNGSSPFPKMVPWLRLGESQIIGIEELGILPEPIVS